MYEESSYQNGVFPMSQVTKYVDFLRDHFEKAVTAQTDAIHQANDMLFEKYQ
jgi:hypothetical protein